MMNVRQIWEETTNRLEKVYVRREAENVSFLLLEDLFKISKSTILVNEEIDLDKRLLDSAIDRLLDGEPIQYVTGVVEFYGRRFEIRTGALIPRPETEELVGLVLKENTKEKPKIFDIGVGSGCIAITLALETQGEVYGSDISEKALHIARNNASRLNADVSFIKHDILRDKLEVGKPDILVSNPPYIPESDKKEMHVNVLDFEPGLALFVSDNDPLIFYRRIAEEGLNIINSGGKLYFEIHERFGNEVMGLLEDFDYKNVQIYQDMQGKDRIISAYR